MSSDSPIYPNPRNLYQEFVNAYKRQNGAYHTNEKIKQNADRVWTEIKQNKDNVNKFIKSAPPVTKSKYKQAALSFLVRSVETTPLTQSSSISSTSSLPCSPPSTSPTSSIGKQPNTNSVFLDRIEHKKNLNDSKIRKFLLDVLGEKLYGKVQNDANLFDEEMHTSTLLSVADSWVVYEGLVEKYTVNITSTRNKETNLSSSITSIKNVIEEIKTLYLEATSINLTPSIGLTLLAKNAVDKKQVLLQCIKLQNR